MIPPVSTCFNRETNADNWKNKKEKSVNHFIKIPRKINKPSGQAVLQLNVEGLTRPKCEAVQRIATKHSALVNLLQETHTTSNDNIKGYGYSLIGAIHYSKFGTATLVRKDLTATLVQLSKKNSEIQWLTIMINDDISITNIYKPQKSPFLPLPLYQYTAIYSGDFDCHHTTSYSSKNHDGEVLYDWAYTEDLKLLFDHKRPKSFYTAVWNKHTNPELNFYSCDLNSLSPHPVHKIGGNFPKSQHYPTINHHQALVEYTPTTPIPCCYFNKADWGHFKTESESLCHHRS